MKKTKISECISGGYILELGELDGKSLICNSAGTFTGGIDKDFLYFNKPGIATKKTSLRVNKVIADANCQDMFSDLPGTWNEKWLSQSQIIEYCRTLPLWLREAGSGTFFIIKRDEEKPIDEENPSANLALVGIDQLPQGLVARVADLDWEAIWPKEMAIWIVYPGAPIV
jgi:hypothetical protein